jgi:hypothetical protein
MNTGFHRSEKKEASAEDNDNNEGGDNSKMSVHFHLKGPGVSENPKGRTLERHTSDLCESSPFRSKTERAVVDGVYRYRPEVHGYSSKC